MTKIAGSEVRAYRLAAPNKEAALISLNRIMDSEEAHQVWQMACERCKVSLHPVNLDELTLVFQYISTFSGNVGVIGKSLTVRINTYKILKRNENGNRRKERPDPGS